MRDSISTFIETSQNELAVAAMKQLCTKRSEPMEVILVGPKLSGKTTLLRGTQGDLFLIDKEIVCYATGADIKMNLEIESDDSFFEKIGKVPILLLDNAELANHSEMGDKLIALLIQERRRQKLDTIITLETPLSEAGFDEAASFLESFDVIPIAPLDLLGQVEYAKLIEKQYCKDKSPKLDDSAYEYIVESANGSYYEIENRIHYLMVGTDYSNDDVLSALQVKQLF